MEVELKTEIDRRAEEVYMIFTFEEAIYIDRILKTIVEIKDNGTRYLHITREDAHFSRNSYSLQEALKRAYAMKNRTIEKYGRCDICLDGTTIYDTDAIVEDVDTMREIWKNDVDDDYTGETK